MAPGQMEYFQMPQVEMVQMGIPAQNAVPIDYMQVMMPGQVEYMQMQMQDMTYGVEPRQQQTDFHPPRANSRGGSFRERAVQEEVLFFPRPNLIES